MTLPGTPFDPDRLFRSLAEHGVRYVLIGGWAAKLQGSPSVTADLDLCYDRDPENLERLAAAMARLTVRLRGVAEDVPFVLDARTLGRTAVLTLTTDIGDIDLLASPAGSGGYEDLAARADTFELGDVRVPVASIADLIAMKRAAGRPKDRIEVEILEALRDEARPRHA
jgi:hypothetical protein